MPVLAKNEPNSSPRSALAKELLEKLEARSARVGVVGMGYVGLPLATAFAEAGFRVIGIDTDGARVEGLRRGESDVPDVSSCRLDALVKAKRIEPDVTYKRIVECDAIVVCVPTPLRKNRDPDISYIVAATESVAENARRGQLVVLESTTYPGTTREVVQPRLEERELTVGESVFLSFSPERIDPGNRSYGIRNTPKVVGGITADCTRLTAALYGTAVDSVVEVSSPEAAEMAKLLENTFRAVNIGLANEVALLCERLGLDVWEVVRAAATKPFGFLPFTPGPGIGGHCIPVDPLYLSWKVRGMDVKTRFIDLADDVNRSMPAHAAEGIANLLNECRKSVKGSAVLLLGVAYKRNVGDLRESPAIDVAKLLHARGAALSYHDPFVRRFVIEEAGAEPLEIPRVEDLSRESLARFDAVAVLTDHLGVDYRALVRDSRAVYDARNATAGIKGRAVVHRLGVGG